MGEYMKKNLIFIFTDKMFEINNSQRETINRRNLRQKLPPAGTEEFLTEKLLKLLHFYDSQSMTGLIPKDEQIALIPTDGGGGP